MTRIKTPRPPRPFPDDIDGILRDYGPLARVVQLWRQVDGMPNEWTYLGRLAPEQCDIQLIAERFGGGVYRAKIFGAWNRRLRREEYLEQVSVSIARQFWPMTAETLAKTRMQRQR